MVEPEPAPSFGALRMRRYRIRRRRGLRCIRVDLLDREIDQLIRRRYLAESDRDDPSAIREALHRFFEKTLGGA